MKIAFDAKRLFNNTSGLGNYSRTLVGQLLRTHPSDRFSLFTPAVRLDVPYLPADNAEIVRPAGIWTHLKSVWRTYAPGGICRRQGIDIYHGLSHELPVGLKKRGIKSVVTIHDLIFLRHPEFYSPVDVWIHTRKVRYACRTADAVIAISQQTRRDIVELLGTPPEKIEVVYQSISPVYGAGPEAGQAEKDLAPLCLPEDFVLCVGTIERRKNQLALLQAMRQVPAVRLVVVGRRSGRYYRELVKYIAANGLSDRVTFLSGVSSRVLAGLYKKCRFVAYPSVYEGFGLPIVEAIGSGKAVLTSSGGCFAEAGGPGALYAPSDDVEAIAAAMRRLWEDEALRRELATAGREYIRRFSDAGTSERVYAVYERVLSAPAKR